LERAFAFFNKELFSGELDRKVIITIQSRGRKAVLGWHWAGKWKNGDTASLAEINLSAEDLKTGDPYEILIHEMAHHLNFQRGIRDVSDRQYHNLHFKKAAEDAGLCVTKAGRAGFGITALGERAKEALLQFKPEPQVFGILRIQETARSLTKLKKWTCLCGVNVRVARPDFSATCNLCASVFQLKEVGQ
jgi:hypothetical protein